MNHSYYKKDGVWYVKCNETGGSFCTILWKNGKVPDKKCVCCEAYIRN